MLTEERIKQLAIKATRCFRDPTVPTTITEDAIRLAIAETAEACAKVCERLQGEMEKAGGYEGFADGLYCATAIRAAAKGAK